MSVAGAGTRLSNARASADGGEDSRHRTASTRDATQTRERTAARRPGSRSATSTATKTWRLLAAKSQPVSWLGRPLFRCRTQPPAPFLPQEEEQDEEQAKEQERPKEEHHITSLKPRCARFGPTSRAATCPSEGCWQPSMCLKPGAAGGQVAGLRNRTLESKTASPDLCRVRAHPPAAAWWRRCRLRLVRRGPVNVGPLGERSLQACGLLRKP